MTYSTECIRRVELQINNNITSNCKTTGGKANQYDWTPKSKWIVDIDYNSATEKILMDYQTGARVYFNWNNDGNQLATDGKWSLLHSAGVGYLTAPPKTYNGEFLGIRLEIDNWYYSGSPITIIYTDTIDWAL